MIDLDAIQARADAATPGPWIVAPPQCGPDGQGVYQQSSLGPVCEVGDPYPRGDNRPQESMEFIAASRTDVPELVTEIRRLREYISTGVAYFEEHAADNETGQWWLDAVKRVFGGAA